MHILYIDDSGSPDNPDDKFFILGGISVFERGIYHLIKAADDLVRSFGIGEPDDIEIHGSSMYSGKSGVWKTLSDRTLREDMIRSSLALLRNTQSTVRLFAVAVDRAAVSPGDPISIAFEEVCNRFNLYLQRENSRRNDQQRGLIVMDDSKHERPIQKAITYLTQCSR